VNKEQMLSFSTITDHFNVTSCL